MTAKAIERLKEDFPAVYDYIKDLDEQGCLIPLGADKRPIISFKGMEPLPKLPNNCETYAIETVRAGLAVIDLDRNHADGGDGVARWKELKAEHGIDDSASYWQKTPSGGFHKASIVPRGRGVKSRNDLGNFGLEGVDIKGVGEDGSKHAFFLGPGSRAHLKRDGKQTEEFGYYWPVEDRTPQDDFPIWFLDEIAKRDTAREAARRAEALANYSNAGIAIGGMTPYKQKKLERIADEMASTPQGQIDSTMLKLIFKLGANGITWEALEPVFFPAAVRAGATQSHVDDPKWRAKWEKGSAAYDPSSDKDWAVNPHLKQQQEAVDTKRSVATVTSPQKSKPKPFELLEEHFSKPLIGYVIDKCKTLDKAKDLARTFASSKVPDELWRAQLEKQLDQVVSGQKQIKKFETAAIKEAIEAGVEGAAPELAAVEPLLTAIGRTAYKKAQQEQTLANAARDDKGRVLNSSTYWTDLNLANVIAERLPQQLRYVADWKKWILYNETNGLWEKSKTAGEEEDGNSPAGNDFFQRLGVDSFEQLVLHHLDEIRSQAIASGNTDAMEKSLVVESAGKIQAVQLLLEKKLRISGARFDTRKTLVHFANGVWDLDTREFLDHSADYYLTKGSMTTWLEGFKSELFEEMLTFTHADNLPYLRFKVFSSLVGFQPRDSGLVILQGPARSGKSTFVDTLERIAGSYFKKLDDSALTHGGSNNYELADLEGRRGVVISEFPDKHIPSGMKKMFNEQTMKVRPIFEAPRTIPLMMDFWITANSLPQIADTDDGIWRRTRLVKAPFAFKDTAADLLAPDDRLANPRLVRLTQADKDELDLAMVAWAMEEAATYEIGQQELPESDSMKHDKNAWRGETDPQLGCLDVTSVLEDGYFMTMADAHAAYNEWAKKNNYGAMNANTFGNRMTNHALLKKLPIQFKNGSHTGLTQSHFKPEKTKWSDMDTPAADTPAPYSCRFIQGLRFREEGDAEPRISSILFGVIEDAQLTDDEQLQKKIKRLELELEQLKRNQSEQSVDADPDDEPFDPEFNETDLLDAGVF